MTCSMVIGHATQQDGIVLSQGLGLNQQELEMRSILVRVQQELLKAAVHTRQQQGTNLQEQSQEKTAGEAQVVRQEVKSKEEQQAGLEEVEEDIVELENLMRVNFLVVADEVELLVAADEEEQDSEK